MTDNLVASLGLDTNLDHSS